MDKKKDVEMVQVPRDSYLAALNNIQTAMTMVCDSHDRMEVAARCVESARTMISLRVLDGIEVVFVRFDNGADNPADMSVVHWHAYDEDDPRHGDMPTSDFLALPFAEQEWQAWVAQKEGILVDEPTGRTLTSVPEAEVEEDAILH